MFHRTRHPTCPPGSSQTKTCEPEAIQRRRRWTGTGAKSHFYSGWRFGFSVGNQTGSTVLTDICSRSWCQNCHVLVPYPTTVVQPQHGAGGSGTAPLQPRGRGTAQSGRATAPSRVLQCCRSQGGRQGRRAAGRQAAGPPDHPARRISGNPRRELGGFPRQTPCPEALGGPGEKNLAGFRITIISPNKGFQSLPCPHRSPKHPSTPHREGMGDSPNPKEGPWEQGAHPPAGERLGKQTPRGEGNAVTGFVQFFEMKENGGRARKRGAGIKTKGRSCGERRGGRGGDSPLPAWDRCHTGHAATRGTPGHFCPPAKCPAG